MPSPGVCLVSQTLYDVCPEQYPSVIRELIRHEDEITNHRIMWLLVAQGFLANAYVIASNDGGTAHFMLSLVGILVALSAFIMLFRSYQARGYLHFLGQQAKHGTLREEYLPLMGWPRNRIEGWRNDWVCRWIRRVRDLLEPWLLLPYIFTTIFFFGLLHATSSLDALVISVLGLVLSAVILSLCCIALVWSQDNDDRGADA